ncbi:MAG TPA: hypothetical protein VGR62_24380 [Candidatus Binatia bacterium]|jgi:hypothetical protein|nr:hypothetical protein [Candidatus Binatia bacterium]
MADLAPAGSRMTSEHYFHLVDHGGFEPDDRVELLEGVVVTVPPANPLREAVTAKVAQALKGAGLVRVSRAPDPAAARYARVDLVHRGARLSLVALSGISIAIDHVLPLPRA